MMLAASLALPVSLPSGHCRSYLPPGPAACRVSVPRLGGKPWHPQLPVLLLVAKHCWQRGQSQGLPRGNLPGSEARLGQPLARPPSQYNHGSQPRPPPSLAELALSSSQSGRDEKLLKGSGHNDFRQYFLVLCKVQDSDHLLASLSVWHL